MKKILHILLFSSVLMNCQSQKTEDVVGEFYVINRSGFVEITITKDSIFNRKLFPDFSNKRNKKRGNSIEKQAHVNDKVLLLKKDEENSELYTSVMTLMHHEHYIKYVINNIDTTASLETIIKLNKNEKRSLLGFNLYSKEQIESFQQMKPIESMTLNEFKDFLKMFSKKMKAALHETSKSNFNGVYGGRSSLDFQIVTQTLLETGFNPVQNSTTINTLFKKYLENPEIKELMEQLKKEK